MLKLLHALHERVCTYIHPLQVFWCTPFKNRTARVKSMPWGLGARVDMTVRRETREINAVWLYRYRQRHTAFDQSLVVG